MPPLQGAVPLAEEQTRSVLITEDLHLDVPGAREIPLEIHRRVPEHRSGHARVAANASTKSRSACTTVIPRPPPPAAALMITGYPISWAIRRPSTAVRTGSTTPGSSGRPASAISRRAVALLPMSCMTDAGGPDEGEALRLADLREVRILGQESVPGVYRVGTGLQRRLDDVRNVEITLSRGGGADVHRRVSHPHDVGVPVGRAVHGDDGDAELSAGPRDADRDLAPVGDQQLLDHGSFLIMAVPPRG